MLRSSSSRTAIERAASVANFTMLRANVLPSSLQIKAIEEYTSLLKSELASLPSKDIPTRKRILAQLDVHRAILAPIRRLPKELLIEIFFLLAYESPFRTLYVAVTLARVCAVWRAVAHGLSKLWTKLVVKSVHAFAQYCELFLPITTKERRPGLRCDGPEILGRLWDRIEPYASCWSSLSLVGRLSVLPDLRVLHMANLERLVIDAYDAPDSPELSVLDFVVAPRLRHIGLTLDVLQSARQLHVPVTRTLTSLMVQAMSPFPVSHVLPLLRECADTLQLLILKIRRPLYGHEEAHPTSASAIFEMASLTDLRINDSACALLNHISAPLITQLLLSTVPTYGPRALLGFLTRNHPSRHLMVFRVYQTQERDMAAWIPCIELMPSVRDLHFDELLSNEAFLRMLIRHPDRPPILPSLKNIAIANIYDDHEELQDLICEMCKSRAKIIDYKGAMAVIPLGWFVDVWDHERLGGKS